MKILSITSILCLILSSCIVKQGNSSKKQEDETITGVKFLFPEYFGRAIQIKAEIVERPMTYYARNYNKTPFYLRVLEVDGKALKKTVLVELKTQSKKEYKFGSKHEFYVYERLREVGWPQIGDSVRQTNLHYRNQLVEIVE